MNNQAQTTKSVLSQQILKPIISGSLVVALDMATSRERKTMYRSGLLGATVAIADIISTNVIQFADVPIFLPDIGNLNGKTAEVKLFEIGGTYGVAYGLDALIVGAANFSNYDVMQKLLIIATADIAAETITDYITHMK